jgi:hypothetical protein
MSSTKLTFIIMIPINFEIKVKAVPEPVQNITQQQQKEH